MNLTSRSTKEAKEEIYNNKVNTFQANIHKIIINWMKRVKRKPTNRKDFLLKVLCKTNF